MEQISGMVAFLQNLILLKPSVYALLIALRSLFWLFGKDLHRFSSDAWIVSGEGADSTGGYSLVLVINQEGELIEKIKVYNPFYPKEGFISGSFAGIIPYDDGWALHANIVNPSTVPKSSDLYIVKFDGSFNTEWTKIIVNPLLSEGAFSLGQFAGNLLLGAWRTNVNFVQKNFKGQIYLVKLSPTGEVLKVFYTLLPRATNSSWARPTICLWKRMGASSWPRESERKSLLIKTNPISAGPAPC
ncbi:MAG: hypothetical protein IPH04_11275 [Saprospirales bacterium]|nr:hypothetical protein [Saprospirales bacterium]